MKFIAFVGRKRSGKDTAAGFVQEQNDEVTIYQLAGPIKEALVNSYHDTKLYETCGVELSAADWSGESGYDRESPLVISNDDVKRLMLNAVKYLTTYYGLPVRPKNELKSVSTFIMEVENLIAANRTPWSVRRLMQTLGTDVIVNLYDTHFWNRCMMEAYFDADIHATTNDRYFVVTDIRQKHEISIARSLGVKLIFIERDDINNSTDNHITEAGLTPLPGESVVTNNGTLEEFKAKILEVIQ